MLLVVDASTQSRPSSLFPPEVRWTISLYSTLAAPPRYDGTRAYIPLTNQQFVAYDLTTGTRIWIAPVACVTRPAAGDGRVFVDSGGRLAALDQATGAQMWSVTLDEPLAAPLTWDNGWLVAATFSGRILAYRATDGGLIWEQHLGAPASAPAALAADRVYVPLADHRVVALNVASGEEVWTRRFGAVPQEILALDDRLYFGTMNKRFYSLIARSGVTDWDWPLGGDVVGVPVLDNRLLYVTSRDNVLRAMDRRSGVLKWQTSIPLRPTSGPQLTGTSVLLAGVSPTIRTYAASDGDPENQFSPAGDRDLVAPPYVIQDSVRPTLIVITGNIAEGDEVHAVSRRIEPAPVPIAPLKDPAPVPVPVPKAR